MSTNIITGFEITNDFTITDGQLKVSTNDVDSSLDVSGNITIGVINNSNKSKLIVKDLSDAEINLLSKNGSNTISHKIINKNGNLKFENDNSNKLNYEFKVDSNSSIGIIKCNNENESGFIFGKNTSEADGIQTYNNGNITLNNTNRNLMLTSEKITLNISDTNYDTRTESLIINSSSNIGLRMLNPLYRLHIKDDNTTSENVQDLLCLENTGNSIGKSGTGILFRQQYGTGSTTIHNKAKIEVRDASDNGGDFIFYIHEQNANADDTLKEIMLLKSDKTVDICGNLSIHNGSFSGNVNSNSLICNNISILHDNPAVELDISGVGAIRIPCGTNNDRDNIVLGALPGYIRFNTTLSQYEGYDGTNWRGLGGVVSLNQDTYIDANDNNGLSFIVGSNEEMRINLNGDVGIGTLTPYNKLQIKSDNGLTISGTPTTGERTAVLRLGSPYATNHDAYCAKITSTNNHDNNYSSDLRFYTSNGNNAQATERMTILSNGNVGINVNNPGVRFDVQTTNSNTEDVLVNLLSDANPSGTSYTSLKIQKGLNYGGLIKGFITQGVGSGLELWTLNAGTQKISMRLMSNGCIGMGTTSPTYKLQIYSQSANTMHSDGNVSYDNGFYLSGPSNYYGRCFVLENRIAGASHSSRPVLFRNLGGVGEWFAGKAENGCGIVVIDSVGPSDNNSNTGGTTYYNTGVSFLVGTNLDYSNRKTNFLIKQNGNVGIGTNEPQEALDIDGNILIRATTSADNGGSPYYTGERGIFFRPKYTPSTNSGDALYNCSITAHAHDGSHADGLCLAGYDGISFRTGSNERMRITQGGNIGIGYTDPQDKIHTTGNIRISQNGVIRAASNSYSHSGSITLQAGGNGKAADNVHPFEPSAGGYLKLQGTWNDNYLQYVHNNSTRFIVKGSRVGIGGTATPRAPLEVTSGVHQSGIGASRYWAYSRNYEYHSSFNHSCSIRCARHIIIGEGGGYGVASWSDRRIKKNIVEIDDGESLKKLRDISCVEYNYKNILQPQKTMGFIAQQVATVIPHAVSKTSAIFPTHQRFLTDDEVRWTSIDISNNTKYKLTIPDLNEISGNILFKFSVKNNNEEEEELIECYSMENEPNSFIFEKKWNNVFIDGKNIEDGHILLKDKLFTLNFSATQELDRKVTILENKTKVLSEIGNLRDTVSKQNNIIADLETKIAILMTRVTQLETSN